jgi:hypothetical protein
VSYRLFVSCSFWKRKIYQTTTTKTQGTVALHMWQRKPTIFSSWFQADLGPPCNQLWYF